MHVAGLVIPVPEDKMHQDERFDTAGNPPFDAKRLILGCFAPIFVMGRSPGPEGAVPPHD